MRPEPVRELRPMPASPETIAALKAACGELVESEFRGDTRVVVPRGRLDRKSVV